MSATEVVTDIRTALIQWQPRIQRDARHRYTLDGKKLSGTTTILGACGLGKQALIHWAAKEELKAAAEVAFRLACSPMTLTEADARARATDDGKAQFIESFIAAAGAERAHQKQLREAGERGTGVHALIEWHLRGAKEGARPEVSEEAEFVYSGFEDWARGARLRPVLLEFYVAHPEAGYGGTIDLLAWVGNVLTVVDWKSGRGTIYPEHRLQNIGYRKAVSAMTGCPLPAGLLVSLPRDGGPIQPHNADEDDRGRRIDPEESWRVFQGVHALHAWGGR